MDPFRPGRVSGPAKINAAKTQCDNGHEFTPENTRTRLSSGSEVRDCLECKKLSRERGRRRRAPKPRGPYGL